LDNFELSFQIVKPKKSSIAFDNHISSATVAHYVLSEHEAPFAPWRERGRRSRSYVTLSPYHRRHYDPNGEILGGQSTDLRWLFHVLVS